MSKKPSLSAQARTTTAACIRLRAMNALSSCAEIARRYDEDQAAKKTEDGDSEEQEPSDITTLFSVALDGILEEELKAPRGSIAKQIQLDRIADSLNANTAELMLHRQAFKMVLSALIHGGIDASDKSNERAAKLLGIDLNVERSRIVTP